MTRLKAYQAILMSSIVLAIIFVCTLFFFVYTAAQHTRLIQDVNTVFSGQTSLINLNIAFERYKEALLSDISKARTGDVLVVVSKGDWKDSHKHFDGYITKFDEQTRDPELKIYIRELRVLSDMLVRFENSKILSSELGRAELDLHSRKFFFLHERMGYRTLQLYEKTERESVGLISKGRAASVLIVVFGTAVAMLLAISVFMALSQTVSKNYVQTIMQTVGVSLFVFDEKGNLTLSNPKVKEVFGHDPSTNKNYTIESFFEKSLCESYLAKMVDFEFETNCRNVHGEWIPVLASGTILRGENESFQGYVVSAQDLRHFKVLQKRLTQAEKMASLGTIAAGVAHEINNPVSFIQSNLSSIKDYFSGIEDVLKASHKLEMKCSSNVSPELREALEELQTIKEKVELDFIIPDVSQAIGDSLEGTERIKEIVQGLRSFSRNDESVLGFVDLNEIIEATLKLIWNELKYKCEVVKEYAPIPSIRCYPRQISQVLMNLLINASQSIEDRGRITLKTESDLNHIMIIVADTGKGMSKDVLGKIFDPFFTTKSVGSGTGLGLSISYGIIKKHGGTIDVESEEGKGTTFKITLPLDGLKNEQS